VAQTLLNALRDSYMEFGSNCVIPISELRFTSVPGGRDREFLKNFNDPRTIVILSF
jgi:hypothetical protein